MRMRADWVVKMAQYVAFKGEYEDVYLELNRAKT